MMPMDRWVHQVRVGIIGLGDWGVCHLQAFQSLPHVKVVALCDIDENRVQALAEQYQVERYYTDLQQFLAHGDMDLVSVVTYEKDHLAPVLQSLQAGKHVLVEKPVSIEENEALQMEQMAQQCGKIIVPGHVLRFDSRYVGMYQAIRNGEIGELASIYMKRSRKKSMFATYQRTHTVYMSTVHDIDLALWYTESKVRKVKAWGRKPPGAEVPNLLWAMLQFENGAVAVMESDWLTPDHAGVDNNDFAEVIGDSGLLRLDVASPGYHLFNDHAGRAGADFHIHYEVAGTYKGALTAQMEYVSECVRLGQSPQYTSFTDAVHGIEVANAIERSIESGAEIMI